MMGRTKGQILTAKENLVKEPHHQGPPQFALPLDSEKHLV